MKAVGTRPAQYPASNFSKVFPGAQSGKLATYDSSNVLGELLLIFWVEPSRNMRYHEAVLLGAKI